MWYVIASRQLNLVVIIIITLLCSNHFLSYNLKSMSWCWRMEAVVCYYVAAFVQVNDCILTAALAASVIGATVALASGGTELYDLPIACSLVGYTDSCKLLLIIQSLNNVIVPSRTSWFLD